jgi:hypothetical protein
LQDEVNNCLDEKKCTFLVTGPNFRLAKQDLYVNDDDDDDDDDGDQFIYVCSHLCSECKMTRESNQIVCEPCKLYCHADHRMDQVDARGNRYFKKKYERITY